MLVFPLGNSSGLCTAKPRNSMRQPLKKWMRAPGQAAGARERTHRQGACPATALATAKQGFYLTEAVP
ncbi:hypothetical protein Defa_04430 [Desulfovibrio sp. TH_2024_36128]|uniref:Uncharacterized protein n=1 Tax=Desulfovibrio falkowii TaxID=3136602 RepID=A0ABQ0E5T0_9BACT